MIVDTEQLERLLQHVNELRGEVQQLTCPDPEEYCRTCNQVKPTYCGVCATQYAVPGRDIGDDEWNSMGRVIVDLEREVDRQRSQKQAEAA